MNKTVSQLLEIANEINNIKLENCGPSDDPDKQYVYAATFRDLLIRFVALAKRLNDPFVDELIEDINDNIDIRSIVEAHYQRAKLFSIVDYLNEIKDDIDYRPTIISNSSFVDKDLLEKLKLARSNKFDFSKLIKFIEELNINYKMGNYLSAILLLRAIINHIPPIFRFKTFPEYVSQANRSIKSILQKLLCEAKPISDLHNHITIRKLENLPSKNQIEPYKPSVEILINEIIIKVEEET